MEFRDLKTQYLQNKTVIDSAIQSVLLSSNFIGGEPVRQLEEKLSDYVGVKHCITCANGTDALWLALMAWDFGEEDAVFVPDFTFFSTGEVVPWVKATPVFVDVDQDTFNISVKSLEEAVQNIIKEGKLIPKAVIAVDLFGQPANFPEIRKITQKYNMLLLEDGAQGFGSAIRGKRACSFGDIATTSFFPAKPLGCYGDGGAVFTNNDEWANKIRSLRVHGKGNDKYDNVRIGMNSRLDTLQAAILLAKLPVFIERELSDVNELARLYSEKLQNIVTVPHIELGMVSSWAQYTIQLKDEITRTRVAESLKDKGIPTAIYYKKPMHRQKAFEAFKSNDDNYSKTNCLCKTVLSLPMHPYLAAEEVDNICKSIESILNQI